MQPPKYPSTAHWPWSEKVHRDDSVYKEPEFFLGKQVVVTEKLDGGNTTLHDGDVYARTHAVPAVHESFSMVKTYHSWKTTQPQFEDLAFYGEEMYGVHTLEYDPMRREDTFRLFAVLELNQGTFLTWGMVEYYAEMLGVKTVPVLYQGIFNTTDEITEFFRAERMKPSLIGGEKEGFVMRIAESFNVRDIVKVKKSTYMRHACKYVRPGHVQTDEHWLRNWKPCKLV